MSDDVLRRTTFERRADLFDELKDAYLEELVDAIVALADLPPQGRILEVGCGSGRATLPFGRRGYRILAVELGARLAELAAQNCRDYPGVTVLNTAFEDWLVEAEAFDLVLSADAFHWIPGDIGYPKAAQALKPSGSVALTWNVPVDPDTEWSRALDAVYARAPRFVNPARRLTAEWVSATIQRHLDKVGRFEPPTLKRFYWTETITNAQHIQNLWTFSTHEGIDEPARQQLYAEVLETLNQFGPTVTSPQSVLLIHARRRP